MFDQLLLELATSWSSFSGVHLFKKPNFIQLFHRFQSLTEEENHLC